MGYGTHALRGFGWTTLVRVYAKVFTLLKIVLLARVLSPADLGAFGLTTILLMLSEVFTETGINSFLIRSSKKIETYIDTAWVTSIARGILISLVMLVLAWPLSQFYQDQSLFPLILIASGVPFLRGFINPSLIRWNKELHFKHEAILRAILMTIEYGVGIVLAYVMKSSYGLMIGILVSVLAEVVLTHVLISPRPSFQWKKSVFREIFGFGIWHNFNTVLHFLGQTVDDLIVGKILGSQSLGYYQTSFNMAQTATNDISDSAIQSVYPVFTRLQQDVVRFRKAVLWSVLPMAIVLGLGSFIFALYAEELVFFVLGPKWLPAVPVLPWLLGAGWLQSLNNLLYPIYLAKGEPKEQFAVNGLYLLFMIIFLVPLTMKFSLIGVGMALFFARLLVQPIAIGRFIHALRRWNV